MGKLTDLPRRGDITRRIDDNSAGMETRGEKAEEVTEDFEKIEETRDALDLSGTEEAVVETEQRLDEGKEITRDEFEEEARELAELQDDSRDRENDLEERRSLSEADAEKVGDAGLAIVTEQTLEKIAESLDVIREDISFMHEEQMRAWESRDESERRLIGLRARIGQEIEEDEG